MNGVQSQQFSHSSITNPLVVRLSQRNNQTCIQFKEQVIEYRHTLTEVFFFGFQERKLSNQQEAWQKCREIEKCDQLVRELIQKGFSNC